MQGALAVIPNINAARRIEVVQQKSMPIDIDTAGIYFGIIGRQQAGG